MYEDQGNGGGFDARLRGHVEALERLELQKHELAEMVKERMSLVKCDGYEGPIVKKVVKEKLRQKADRDRERAILDLYLASIGALDGTPMGDYSRRELDQAMRKHKGKSPEPTDEERKAEDEEALKDAATLPPEETAEQARERGRQAAKDGKVISANPYGPTDARRAAWDEGWCQGAGRTGMEIPESLQRKKPKKKKDDGDGDAAGGSEDQQQDREAA